jgi:hypothetical protein
MGRAPVLPIEGLLATALGPPFAAIEALVSQEMEDENPPLEAPLARSWPGGVDDPDD